MTEISPIKAALDAMRRFDYGRAKNILHEEYERDLHQFELGRIANLIQLGMIHEAIEALSHVAEKSAKL